MKVPFARPICVTAILLSAGCSRAPTKASEPGALRIVSLAPNLTATAMRLGLGEQLIGISTYCVAPEVGKPERVGAYLDPDIETIVSLRPDLVITPPNPGFTKAMAAFDIPVRIVQSQWSTLADTRACIVEVAEALGVRERGEALADAMDRDLAGVRDRARGRPVRKVLFVIDRQPGSLIVVGPGAHLEELIRIAGGENAVAEGSRYPNLNIETVVAVAPEVIIDVSVPSGDLNEATIEMAKKAWRSYDTLPAVRADRVHVVDPSLLVQPGPDVGESAKVLFDLLHGEP